MITELSPLFNRAAISVDAKEVLLQKGSWVRFSNKWPSGSYFDWASGQTLEVASNPVLTEFPIALILPGGDYQFLDLSNQFTPTPGTAPGTAGSVQAYPAAINILYQIGIGLKEGNYFVQLFIPRASNPNVYNVGSSQVFPDLGSPFYRYLGAKKPSDSPDTGPLWFLYAIFNQPAFVLAPYVDGVDYEKVVITLFINKCQLGPVSDQAKLAEAQKKALLIEYYTELQGF